MVQKANLATIEPLLVQMSQMFREQSDPEETSEEECEEDVIHVSNLVIRAHLEHSNEWYAHSGKDKVYAISDSGADQCMIG